MAYSEEIIQRESRKRCEEKEALGVINPQQWWRQELLRDMEVTMGVKR